MISVNQVSQLHYQNTSQGGEYNLVAIKVLEKDKIKDAYLA